jgi:hypothetical protein
MTAHVTFLGTGTSITSDRVKLLSVPAISKQAGPGYKLISLF